MMVITSDRHKEEDRLRWWVSSNCLCHKGSKSKQKSSMSQKIGRMSMKRTPYRSRDEVLVNYILQLGVLFSISCVELTLFSGPPCYEPSPWIFYFLADSLDQ